MKILYDRFTNIVYYISENILETTNNTGEYYLGGNSYVCYPENPNFNIIEINDIQPPEYFFNECYTIDITNKSFSMINEKIPDIISFYSSNLYHINNSSYEKTKFDCFIDENDNIYETSQEFYDFIKSNETKLRNNINNSQIQYSFENKQYTANQLIKILKNY
jgi:hypothetical protein